MIKGKNIVLTGCNSGIGLEVLKLLMQGNNRILCVDKDVDVLSNYESENIVVNYKAWYTNFKQKGCDTMLNTSVKMYEVA